MSSVVLVSFFLLIYTQWIQLTQQHSSQVLFQYLDFNYFLNTFSH